MDDVLNEHEGLHELHLLVILSSCGIHQLRCHLMRRPFLCEILNSLEGRHP